MPKFINRCSNLQKSCRMMESEECSKNMQVLTKDKHDNDFFNTK